MQNTTQPLRGLRRRLLLTMAGAMLLLFLGLCLMTITVVRRSADEISVAASELFSGRSELALGSTLAWQADTVDLQLDQARITARSGALAAERLLVAGTAPDPRFLGDLLDAGGSLCTAVYYLDASEGLRFRVRADKAAVSPAPADLSAAAFFPQFDPEASQSAPTRWSAVHRNPLQQSQDRVVDAVAPVFLDSALKGYVGVSLSLEDLIAQFNDRQLIRGSYSFIVDGQAQLIAAPPHGAAELSSAKRSAEIRPEANRPARTIADALADMGLGNRALERIEIRGGDRYLLYQPLAAIDWRMGLVVPVALAGADAGALAGLIDGQSGMVAMRLLLAALVLLGVLLLVGGWLVRRLLQPLEAPDRVVGSTDSKASHGQ